ncbi:hypothetical protein WG899_08275, partial [Paucibacter sp. AS339]|uniref:hypothetical protein n=1 Tax=Paucibacter hankyongi TaxID=3133434 RepID=UPI0030B1F040
QALAQLAATDLAPTAQKRDYDRFSSISSSILKFLSNPDFSHFLRFQELLISEALYCSTVFR